ncbi:probable inactive receptor kinase [Tanacetum coccineum]
MMMTSSARVFLLVITLLLLRASSDQLEQDAKALTFFITQLEKRPNTKYNWNTSQNNPCAWNGVICGAGNFTVIGLRMPAASLVGQIAPKSIGNITSLRVLSLHKNKLSGPLPDDFANLVKLSHVYLHNNSFSGQFPSSVAKWKRLVALDLSINNFSGRFDNVTSLSSKLVKFSVVNNNLSGPIPSSLAGFSVANFSRNFDLCDTPLSTCEENKYKPFLPLSSDEKEKKLSTGHIVAIAVGSAFILLISSLCLGKKWSRVVKDKNAPGVATMAATAAAKAGEAGTSSKDDVISASMEGERSK